MEKEIKNIPDELIAKFLMNECSESELKHLEEWKMADPKNLEEFSRMKKMMDEATTEAYEPDLENALHSVSQRILQTTHKTPGFLYYGIRIASAIIIGAGILGLVLKFGNSNQITIAALPGEHLKEIILPDGSQVTLNEGSILKYTKKFKGEERNVSFEGEAYFKIARNENKPFIIESGNTITRVLGTEFNLIANKADSVVKITVTEGLVSFNLEKENIRKEVKVGAGQIGEIDVKKGIITSKVNDDLNFLAWKNGILTFDNQEFGVAIQTISSFYGEKIEIQDSMLSAAIFTATFDSLDFDEVLTTIELIMDVNIERENDAFIILEKL